MSVILPAAPANFYTPSLDALKNSLSAINGSTKGQVTLLTDAPVDANTAWSEVGAGNPDIDTARGTLVAGQADIELITGPLPAGEETDEEFGYKLVFAKISNIRVDTQGADSSVILVGFAAIVGRDTFSQGTDDDVKYLFKLEETLSVSRGSSNKDTIGIRTIPVTDLDIVELPEWELIINYAEPIT